MIKFETLENGKTKCIITGDLSEVLKNYHQMAVNYDAMFDALEFDSEELKPNADKEKLSEMHHIFFKMDAIICNILGEVICSQLINIEDY